MTQQLALELQLRDDARFANFSAGDNKVLLALLEETVLTASEQFVYVWGAPGVGRTHLLQACCHLAFEQKLQCFYLPLLTHFEDFSPDVLNGLEACDLLCVDDLQCIAGDSAWEEAFFHLYNRVRERKTRLIMSATQAPKELNIKLPDLVSRLSWGLTFHVEPLQDQDKLDNLHLRAKARGLQLSEEVAKFLLTRCQRDMRSLVSALDMLDQASLVAQRKLTIPFVKETLGL